RAASAGAPAADPVRFAVRHAEGDEAATRWLRAAVQAWNEREPGRHLLDEATLDVPLAADTQWLAWLSPQVPAAVTDWIEAGGTALLVGQAGTAGDALWREADGRATARVATVGKGRVLALPSTLAPEALPGVYDADFPTRLLAAMRGPAPAPDRATAAAARPEITGGSNIAGVDPFAAARPLDSWL